MMPYSKKVHCDRNRGIGPWIIALVIYPIIYWFPALVDEFAHLGIKTTDIDGDFQFAWLMHEQGIGFGKQFLTNVPYGETLWRWQTYTHFLPAVFIWAVSLIVGPMLAVKIYALSGWVFSGWVVARVSRCFGVDRCTAVLTGLLFQVLPWNRYVMENWIHYAWSGVPLMVVLIWMSNEKEQRWRLAFLLRLALILTAATFVDGYWMYYTAFLVLVILSCDIGLLSARFRSASRQSRIAGVVGLSSAGLLSCLIFRAAGNTLIESKGLDRGLAITPKDFLDTYGGKFVDLLTPDYRHLLLPQDSRLVDQGWNVNPIQYVGISVISLAVVGAIWGWRKHRAGTFLTCLVILAMLSLSLRSEFFGMPSLAGIVRPFTPGLQWTWRASIIAQAGIVVLAGLGIFTLRAKCPKGHLTALSVVLLALVDLNPLGGRNVVDQSKPWHKFREVLSSEHSPLVLFVPSSLPTQSWMEQVFVQVPMINGLYDRRSSDELRQADSLGKCNLYRHLKELKITHLIVLSNQSVVLPGYGDLINLRSGEIPNDLFPVRARLQTKIVGRWSSWVELREVTSRIVSEGCQP